MTLDHDVYGTAAVDLKHLIDRCAQRLLEGNTICCPSFRYILVEAIDRDSKLLEAYRNAVDAVNDPTSDLHENIGQARRIKASTKRHTVEEAARFWHRIYTMEVWSA